MIITIDDTKAFHVTRPDLSTRFYTVCSVVDGKITSAPVALTAADVAHFVRCVRRNHTA